MPHNFAHKKENRMSQEFLDFELPIAELEAKIRVFKSSQRAR